MSKRVHWIIVWQVEPCFLFQCRPDTSPPKKRKPKKFSKANVVLRARSDSDVSVIKHKRKQTSKGLLPTPTGDIRTVRQSKNPLKVNTTLPSQQNERFEWFQSLDQLRIFYRFFISFIHIAWWLTIFIHFDALCVFLVSAMGVQISSSDNVSFA